MNKPFQQELYDKHNEPTIEAAIQFLKQYGYTFKDKKESFKSHDIIMEKNGTLVKFEVEQSMNWRNPTKWEGYPTVTCPYRKKDSKSKFYLRFNSTFTGVAVAPMKQIHASPIIYKNTKYTTREPFFDTPISDYDFFFQNLPETENRYL
jgi:hypothetical protein